MFLKQDKSQAMRFDAPGGRDAQGRKIMEVQFFFL